MSISVSVANGQLSFDNQAFDVTNLVVQLRGDILEVNRWYSVDIGTTDLSGANSAAQFSTLLGLI